MDAERLGQQLRAAREARELTLEDVEQALRIRVRFLGAFESGAYEDLPGVVQARGFLRNYARFLRLDEDTILAQFDTIQAALPDAQRTSATSRFTTAPPLTVPAITPDQAAAGTFSRIASSRRRPLVVIGALVGLVALTGLCFGATQLVERVLNTQPNGTGADLVQILPTSPSLTPSSTFLPSATPLPGARVLEGATPITDRVVLDIAVVQRAFIRVTVDGVSAFEGIVTPGTQLQYQAQQTLTLQATNGSGLDVVFNNIPLGLLGTRGEEIDRTFTPDLALTPFAPPTATPQPTADVQAVPVDPATADAAASGKDGQSGDAPTPLPLPDAARDVTGGEPASTTPPEVGAPTALPGLAQPPAALPQPSATVTATASPTATPSLTVTPSPTLSPTPTAVLPPRQTSTPIPQKQG